MPRTSRSRPRARQGTPSTTFRRGDHSTTNPVVGSPRSDWASAGDAREPAKRAARMSRAKAVRIAEGRGAGWSMVEGSGTVGRPESWMPVQKRHPVGGTLFTKALEEERKRGHRSPQRRERPAKGQAIPKKRRPGESPGIIRNSRFGCSLGCGKLGALFLFYFTWVGIRQRFSGKVPRSEIFA